MIDLDCVTSSDKGSSYWPQDSSSDSDVFSSDSDVFSSESKNSSTVTGGQVFLPRLSACATSSFRSQIMEILSNQLVHYFCSNCFAHDRPPVFFSRIWLKTVGHKIMTMYDYAVVAFSVHPLKSVLKNQNKKIKWKK